MNLKNSSKFSPTTPYLITLLILPTTFTGIYPKFQLGTSPNERSFVGNTLKISWRNLQKNAWKSCTRNCVCKTGRTHTWCNNPVPKIIMKMSVEFVMKSPKKIFERAAVQIAVVTLEDSTARIPQGTPLCWTNCWKKSKKNSRRHCRKNT